MSTGLTVRSALAVQTVAYADGDVVGPLRTLSNFARGKGGSGIITRFVLRSLTNITVQTFLHIFDSNPSASTFTDNAALVLNSVDRAKILKTIAIAAADWAAPKGVNPWYTVELIGVGAAIPYLYYDLTSPDRNLYFAIEADGAITFASTSDLAAIISAENN